MNASHAALWPAFQVASLSLLPQLEVLVSTRRRVL